MAEEQEKTGEVRNPDGTFKLGVSGNPEGMKPLTEEQKLARKAQKEIIAEYKQKLAEALPNIEPKLIQMAIQGDITAIKEVHDRVMGKAPQTTDITTGGKPLPILGNVQINYSNEENSETQK